ncbi:MAG TPA: hypothetical protein VFB84_19345 [Micromonosporaceae bacterium]|nr:hypothetical protein [Micromonosporaceae bacterium]
MAEAREVTNSELGTLAGFTLTGQERVDLEKRGLVESRKVGRGLAFQLTEQGWHFCKQLHNTDVNVGNSRVARSIFVLLGGLHRSLDRLRVSHAEFFKPLPDGATGGDDVEGLVRSAYSTLADAPGAWVGLADLREHLGGLDRAAVDEALRALVRQEGVRIIPVANTKALEPRDRAAALRIGGEDNHVLAIGPT